MADRRRRRRIKSDEDSEEVSSESDLEQLETAEKIATQPQKKEGDKPESEYESAEEEEEEGNETSPEKADTKQVEEDIGLPTELIDEEGGEEGGEEGIAEPEDVEGDFLGEELLDGSDGDAEGEEDEEELDEEVVEEERQQGDGEECSPAAEKQLDFDEDRRYPQYIPKKGTFYEHDDRNASEMPKEKVEEPVRDKKKKKLWLDDGKWGHDRYREEEQTPKSTDELIEAYGYDIRCEDAAPRARRRRRYGRGPTKYDRSWEDETAYTKEQVYGIFQRTPRGARRGRGGRVNRAQGFRGGPVYRNSDEKLPRSENHELIENCAIIKSTEESRDGDTTGWETEVDKIKDLPNEVIPPIVKDNPIIVTNEDFPALIPKEPFSKPQPIQTSTSDLHNDDPITLALDNASRDENNSVRTLTFENSNLNSQPKSPMYEQPPRQLKNLPYREPYRDTYKRPPRIVRGKRGVGRSRGGREHYQRPNLAPRLMEKQVRAINSEIDRLTLNDKNDSFEEQDDSNVEHEIIAPPKMNGIKHLNGQSSKNEDASMRPKRYSSLRQRSLPETQNFQSPQAPAVAAPHPTFYEAGYQAALYATENVVPPSNSQPQTTGSPPIINPPQYQFNPAAYPESYALRLPVSNLNNPPRLYPQVTLPTGPPLIGPAPCMAANPTLINYPPPPPPPTAPYPQFTYQQYTAPPPPAPPVSQQPDLYTSGITYYYHQNPQPAMRPVPLKRPKAAIPIVPPPEVERKFIEKKESYAIENQRRNSISCAGDMSNTEVVVVRTDSSTPQPEVEVES